jgi:F-type H+-transporting ATPase subunit b
MITFKTQIKDYRQKLKKTFFYCICVLSYVLSVFTHEIAFAAEEAGHSFNFKDLLWPVINFAILVIILVKFLAKPAKEYFKKRTELIEKSIKEAEAAQEIAQKTLAEVKERLKNIDHDINEILNAAQKAGKNEKEALVAEGEHLKNKILEQAKAQIEFE